LLDPPGEGWGAPAEALLFAAARADHVARAIRPALEAGTWVISDRFVDSSRAYQGGAGGLSDADVVALHRIGSGGLLPDLTLLIEIPPETAARRLARRDAGASDAIGGRDAEYHAQVAAAFARLAQAEPARFARICSDDAREGNACAGHAGSLRAARGTRVTLAGHDQAWREWEAARAGPRLHHGWILSGPRGVGKAVFALRAARELVAEAGVQQPERDHPDIIVVEPMPATTEDEKKRDEGKPYQTKQNISVDQIRAMQRRLVTRPTLGSRRVVLIDPADDLGKGGGNAANALLKSLEEPPAGTYFMLVVHRMGSLLPTIRSRCRLLQFPHVDAADIDAILRREAPDADLAMREAAIAAAGGSPGAALEFVELDLGTIHDLMREIAERGDAEFARRGRLAEAIGARPDRKRQLAAIDLARAVVAARWIRRRSAQFRR
jgi:DNA polymerase-3 subunit delta'